MKRAILAGMVSALALASAAAADIKIAHIYGKTGPYEAYAKQSHDGLMLGLEYATGGTMEINGEKIVVIEKDTQLKPENGKALLEEAYGDDEVDLAIGPVSSGVALAMLPVAEEYEKLLIVEPAVADSITGANWNRYIFRTGRNSSQDAVSNAIALAGEDTHIATLAQDYAFGRDGIAAFKEALESVGSDVAHEEYVPTDTTDFTAAAERIFNAMKDLDGKKKLFVIWAGGGNPMSKINAMDPSRFGIEMATGGNILAAMKAYKEFPGMEGATYYYYEIPQNPVNDWLVKEHEARFGAPPDFFTAGGMTAGIAAVEAIKKAGSTDTEELITAMEGMEWETPKGTMMFRAEDHQALQPMYHFKIKVEDGVEWAVPELVRELSIDELPIPIRNQ
ncbi:MULTISPECIES: substrate-binding domain-containing protein [Rhodobacterales]|jgi:branched-chain amino acid transport system substrate-binding protein|uniref:Substrate-binding domain-containing protein n=1 Tax=Phaeobacter gallaeciensis TaxID=60890 RepID=A0ABD4XCT9_9RHOB|nr:substrate-binding domain-containing protein [Phaeobacter gallaeciensis]MDF1771874.1 substrate-binding domain-containing protein [Pseudophaeobacter sp. bin_em_oilr2.035]MDE4098483.1 substrate-binding domain-containing protein [Phaeobacter gallaeciensis]MDE4107293.1 substrate-binding domain-containing protein [Phaeobacter gallaeciensis]MDE4111755.1 substrate-binding domain-containing protein [Phaeobacter gallaeciensis]MDE4116218.1 substrate-binding domain-containing protein [Phaeobacter galla